MATPKRIFLRGSNEPEYREADCVTAAITPGHLIERVSATTVKPHATAAAASGVEALVARERDVVGDDIDTAYATGDRVSWYVASPGVESYMLLDSGENVAFGALLESAGNGNLQAVTTGQAVFRALEAVNATGGTSRIRVVAL